MKIRLVLIKCQYFLRVINFEPPPPPTGKPGQGKKERIVTATNHFIILNWIMPERADASKYVYRLVPGVQVLMQSSVPSFNRKRS